MAAPVTYRVAKQPQIREGRSADASLDDRPGVIAPAPLLYGAAFLMGMVLHSFFPKLILPMQVAPWTGIVLLSAGAALAVWSRRTMEGANTNVHPALPATTLVITGPFRFSRNPMYVARTVLYLGLGVLVNALCVLVVLVPLLLVMQYGVIKPEERYLEAKFGDVYRQYRAGVRRWL